MPPCHSACPLCQYAATDLLRCGLAHSPYYVTSEVSDRDGIASLSTQLDALAKLGLTLADTIAVMLLKLALKAKRAGPHQDPHTCKNITIFVPDRSARSAYLKREYGKLTPQQLQERLQGDGYRQVLLVDEQPPQLLQLAAAACCGSVKDVEDVVLRDGMRLAVVVNEPVSTRGEHAGWVKTHTWLPCLASPCLLFL